MQEQRRTILWQDDSNKVEAAHINTVCDTVWLYFLVKTTNICGHHTFFISSAEIKQHLLVLSEMYSSLSGTVSLSDTESDAIIRIEKKRDMWCLTGQFGCSWEGNTMTFYIPADQTVIQLLLDFLQSITAESGNP